MQSGLRDFLRITFIRHPGKFIGTVLGFIVGLVMVIFGPIAGLYLAACISIGYLAGNYLDRGRTHTDDIFLEDFFPRDG
ncbi:MAG: DUF2273 domain-containing protein [Firmicutes bacterium]|jgi:cell shape-determining protein MreD|nr:DUF2273 domain-containing protein [Bacillota bacterium]